MTRLIAENDYGKFLLFHHTDTDIVSRTIAEGGRWEPNILAIVEQHVKPGMAVMDIGANIGTFTVRFGQLVGPHGIVYAFEPQRVVYQQLCGNVFLNELHNVYAYNYAVGEKDAIVRLSYVDYDGHPNTGAVQVGDFHDGSVATMVTIDSLEVERLDLVKIDVERYEPYVLQGMHETIKRCRPIILFELTTIPLPGFDRFSAVRYLEQNGYTVTCIDEDSFDYMAVPNAV